MTTATLRKTVMIRDMDAYLWDRVRERAKAEGLYMRAWIERALERELERTGTRLGRNWDELGPTAKKAK